MKLIKLTALSVAVLASSAAMANQQPSYQYNGTNAAAANQQPVYQYNSDAGIVRNTTGAIAGTTQTLFNTVTHPGAISAEIGTLGYGANIAWGLNETTELQAGWSGMSFDDDTELNSNDSWINYDKALGDGYEDFKGQFDYDVDLSNPYLGVQLRPWANNFTIGTGVYVPSNEFKGRITVESNRSEGGINYSPVTIDGKEYRFADGSTVDVEIENKNDLAPYLTLGYRPNINQNFGGFIEAGAAYMGDVKANVRAEGTLLSGQSLQEFEREAESEIQDEDYLEWYPILKAGLTYRF